MPPFINFNAIEYIRFRQGLMSALPSDKKLCSESGIYSLAYLLFNFPFIHFCQCFFGDFW